MGFSRFLAALGRLISFKWLRSSEKVNRAADAVFTKDAEGIGLAFDIEKDERVKEYQELFTGVAQVETVQEQDRQELETLNSEEEELIPKRADAVRKIAAAKEANDPDAVAKHTAAFNRFDSRIQAIEKRQAELAARVAEQDAEMQQYMAQLTELQAKIDQLPKEKAQAIADFVGSTQKLKVLDRLAGRTRSSEKRAIDAVLEHNRELTAKARVASKMRSTDVHVQDAEYAAGAKTATSNDRLESMLAAMQVEKAAKTGEKPVSATRVDERPTI